MADLINLRRARKEKARSEAEKKAAANRALSGRTKGQKRIEAAEKQKAETEFARSKRERAPEPSKDE